jgi:SAM-dependent methyltransferase
MTSAEEPADTIESWEDRYSGQDQIWSGRVNPVLAEVAADLEPGTVLDLGSGEGGDAVWLAQHGWQVTAVDISQTALARTRSAADEAGVAARIRSERYDLTADFPDETFDLVSAQYLHSSGDFPRTAVLQAAAGAVEPGGRLLIVDHGAPPPWMPADHAYHHDFPPVQEVFDALDLAEDRWRVERMDTARRQATGPSGETGELIDNVILAKHLA